jgi:pyruvate/oxaloacetate carboxyltransferase/GMP synthase-like glutamine amidotransferase
VTPSLGAEARKPSHRVPSVVPPVSKRRTRSSVHRPTSLFRGAVAVVYLWSNVLAVHAAESSLWEERRQALRRDAPGASLDDRPPQLGLEADRAAASELNRRESMVLAQLPAPSLFGFGASGAPTVAGGVSVPVVTEGLRPFSASGADTAEPSAEPSSGKEAKSHGWLSTLILPYGTLRDIHLARRPGAPLVIHIQDAHELEEAQRNIASMVQLLRETRGVDLVGLEGAEGPFVTEAFRRYVDPAVAKGIADYFLKENYVGGAEHVALSAPQPPLLWGVEDKALYDGNIASFRASLEKQPALHDYLRRAGTALGLLKSAAYSRPLQEFDRRYADYHAGTASLSDYVRFLMDGVSPSAPGHTNLHLLLNALAWEETIDFAVVEAERLALVKAMSAKLSEARLDELVRQSLLYRLGQMSYGEYHRYLRRLCRESGIEWKKYPQLDSYITYVLLAEQIDRNALTAELARLEEEAPRRLVETPEQAALLDLQRDWWLLDKLSRHAMTPADWLFVERQRAALSAFAERLRAAAESRSVEAPVPAEPLAGLTAPFDAFCRDALSRNAALVGNLLRRMESGGTSAAVLVAGGFHSDGIARLLREKDVSYVVVTPKITEAPAESRYLDVFARDPVPLEKVFAGDTVYLAAPRVFAASSADLRTQVAQGLLASLPPAALLLLKDMEEGRGEGRDAEADADALIRELRQRADELAAELPRLEGLRLEPGPVRRGVYRTLRFLLRWTPESRPARYAVWMAPAAKASAAGSLSEGDGLPAGRVVVEGRLSIGPREVVFRVYRDASWTDRFAGFAARLRRRAPADLPALEWGKLVEADWSPWLASGLRWAALPAAPGIQALSRALYALERLAGTGPAADRLRWLQEGAEAALEGAMWRALERFDRRLPLAGYLSVLRAADPRSSSSPSEAPPEEVAGIRRALDPVAAELSALGADPDALALDLAKRHTDYTAAFAFQKTGGKEQSELVRADLARLIREKEAAASSDPDARTVTFVGFGLGTNPAEAISLLQDLQQALDAESAAGRAAPSSRWSVRFIGVDATPFAIANARHMFSRVNREPGVLGWSFGDVFMGAYRSDFSDRTALEAVAASHVPADLAAHAAYRGRRVPAGPLKADYITHRHVTYVNAAVQQGAASPWRRPFRTLDPGELESVLRDFLHARNAVTLFGRRGTRFVVEPESPNHDPESERFAAHLRWANGGQDVPVYRLPGTRLVTARELRPDWGTREGTLGDRATGMLEVEDPGLVEAMSLQDYQDAIQSTALVRAPVVEQRPPRPDTEGEAEHLSGVTREFLREQIFPRLPGHVSSTRDVAASVQDWLAGQGKTVRREAVVRHLRDRRLDGAHAEWRGEQASRVAAGKLTEEASAWLRAFEDAFAGEKFAAVRSLVFKEDGGVDWVNVSLLTNLARAWAPAADGAARPALGVWNDLLKTAGPRDSPERESFQRQFTGVVGWGILAMSGGGFAAGPLMPELSRWFIANPPPVLLTTGRGPSPAASRLFLRLARRMAAWPVVGRAFRGLPLRRLARPGLRIALLQNYPRTMTGGMIAAFLEAQGVEVETFVASAGHLPDLDRFDGVIGTGSAFNVDELRDEPWVRSEMNLFRRADVPALGVCFSHQLIAEAFGGRTRKSDDYDFYVGVDRVAVDGDNPLFRGLPSEAYVAEAHGREVSRVPEGFVVTARSARTRVEGMRHAKRPLYTVQFHPEWAAPLREHGLANDAGLAILQNFVDIVRADKESRLREYGVKVSWWLEEAVFALLPALAAWVPGLAAHLFLVQLVSRVVFVALHWPGARGPPLGQALAAPLLVSVLPLAAAAFLPWAGLSVAAASAVTAALGFASHGFVNLGVYRGWSWLPGRPAAVAPLAEKEYSAEDLRAADKKDEAAVDTPVWDWAAFWAGVDRGDTVRAVRLLRPVLSALEHHDGYRLLTWDERRAFQDLRKKIEKKIPIDGNYRRRVLEDFRRLLEGLGAEKRSALWRYWSERPWRSLERQMKYSTELRAVLSADGALRVSVEADLEEPVVYDAASRTLRLDLAAFLSPAAEGAQKQFLVLEARKIMLLRELEKSSAKDADAADWAPRLGDVAALAALLQETDDLNKRLGGSFKRVHFFNRPRLLGELRSLKRKEYVRLLNRLDGVVSTDERVAVVHGFLAGRGAWSDADAPSAAEVAAFLARHAQALERARYAYMYLETKAAAPAAPTAPVLPVGTTATPPSTGPSAPPAAPETRVVVRPRLSEVERSEDDSVPRYAPSFARPRPRPAAGPAPKDAGSRGDFSRRTPTVEYRTPGRGEDHYLRLARTTLDGRTPSGDERTDAAYFLAEVLPKYFLALADGAVSKPADDPSGLRAALLAASDRWFGGRSAEAAAFRADLRELLSTDPTPALVEAWARRFRNSPYLQGLDLFLGLELVRFTEGGKSGQVLYGMAHRIDRPSAEYLVHNPPIAGSRLPIHFLGARLDRLDQDLSAFGFTYLGDIFGVVVKAQIRRFVAKNVLPVLEGRPFADDAGARHPLSDSVAAFYRNDFAGRDRDAIESLVSEVTALHEMQHTVDELLTGAKMTVVESETSAYLASVALGRAPFTALVKPMLIYTDPWSPLFAPAHRAAAERILRAFSEEFGLAWDDAADPLDRVESLFRAVREAGLDAPALRLAGRRVHERLVGAGMLARLEPDRAAAVEAEPEPTVSAAIVEAVLHPSLPGPVVQDAPGVPARAGRSLRTTWDGLVAALGLNVLTWFRNGRRGLGLWRAALPPLPRLNPWMTGLAVAAGGAALATQSFWPLLLAPLAWQLGALIVEVGRDLPIGSWRRHWRGATVVLLLAAVAGWFLVRGPPDSPPAPAATAPAAVEAPAPVRHRVRTGDSFSELSARYLGSVWAYHSIHAANAARFGWAPLPADHRQGLVLPRVGDVLEIPGARRPYVYTVRSGDSLIALARSYYGGAEYADLLFRANFSRIPDKTSRGLREGQELVFPDFDLVTTEGLTPLSPGPRGGVIELLASAGYRVANAFLSLAGRLTGRRVELLSPDAGIEDYGVKVAWWFEELLFGLLPAAAAFLPGLAPHFFVVQLVVRLAFVALHLFGWGGRASGESLSDRIGAAVLVSLLPLAAAAFLPFAGWSWEAIGAAYAVLGLVSHGLVNIGVYRGWRWLPARPASIFSDDPRARLGLDHGLDAIDHQVAGLRDLPSDPSEDLASALRRRADRWLSTLGGETRGRVLDRLKVFVEINRRRLGRAFPGRGASALDALLDDRRMSSFPPGDLLAVNYLRAFLPAEFEAEARRLEQSAPVLSDSTGTDELFAAIDGAAGRLLDLTPLPAADRDSSLQELRLLLYARLLRRAGTPARALRLGLTTSRDGQQSNIGTSMTGADQRLIIERQIELGAGIHDLETWGGAAIQSLLLESIHKDKPEDPWVQLRKVTELLQRKLEEVLPADLTAADRALLLDRYRAAKDRRILSDAELSAVLARYAWPEAARAAVWNRYRLNQEMLLRGQYIVGLAAYPDSVLKLFIETSYKNGMDVFRIFDALNDTRNIVRAVKFARDAGARVQPVIHYTTGFPTGVEGYVALAKELIAASGPALDSLVIKDAGGLLEPQEAYRLVKALRDAGLTVPIHLHTHDTRGNRQLTLLEAVRANGSRYPIVVDVAAGKESLSAPFAQPDLSDFLQLVGDTPWAGELGLDPGKVKALDEFIAKEVMPRYPNRLKASTLDRVRAVFARLPGGMKTNFLDRQIMENFGDRVVGERTVQGYGASVVKPIYGVDMFDASGRLTPDGEKFIAAMLELIYGEMRAVTADTGGISLVTPTSQWIGVQAFNNVMGWILNGYLRLERVDGTFRLEKSAAYPTEGRDALYVNNLRKFSVAGTLRNYFVMWAQDESLQRLYPEANRELVYKAYETLGEAGLDLAAVRAALRLDGSGPVDRAALSRALAAYKPVADAIGRPVADLTVIRIHALTRQAAAAGDAECAEALAKGRFSRALVFRLAEKDSALNIPMDLEELRSKFAASRPQYPAAADTDEDLLLLALFPQQAPHLFRRRQAWGEKSASAPSDAAAKRAWEAAGGTPAAIEDVSREETKSPAVSEKGAKPLEEALRRLVEDGKSLTLSEVHRRVDEINAAVVKDGRVDAEAYAEFMRVAAALAKDVPWTREVTAGAFVLPYAFSRPMDASLDEAELLMELVEAVARQRAEIAIALFRPDGTPSRHSPILTANKREGGFELELRLYTADPAEDQVYKDLAAVAKLRELGFIGGDALVLTHTGFSSIKIEKTLLFAPSFAHTHPVFGTSTPSPADRRFHAQRPEFPAAPARAPPRGWSEFVPGGIDRDPPWAKDPDYEGMFSQRVFQGGDRGSDAHLSTFRSFLETVPGALDALRGQEGLVIGFGREPGELPWLKEAFGLSRVHGAEWAAEPVREAAERFLLDGRSPDEFVLHHADMRDLGGRLADGSVHVVYGLGMTYSGREGTAAFARELARILAPGGYLFLNDSAPAFVRELSRHGEFLKRPSDGVGTLLFRRNAEPVSDDWPELVARLVRETRPKEQGGEAAVYDVPGRPEFVLRVPHALVERLKAGLVPWDPEIVLDGESDISSLDNVSRTLFRIGDAQVLTRQAGDNLYDLAERDLDGALRFLAEGIPQAAFDELARTVKALNAAGRWWDSAMVNLLWDGASGRFRLVDVHREADDQDAGNLLDGFLSHILSGSLVLNARQRVWVTEIARKTVAASAAAGLAMPDDADELVNAFGYLGREGEWPAQRDLWLGRGAPAPAVEEAGLSAAAVVQVVQKGKRFDGGGEAVLYEVTGRPDLLFRVPIGLLVELSKPGTTWNPPLADQRDPALSGLDNVSRVLWRLGEVEVITRQAGRALSDLMEVSEDDFLRAFAEAPQEAYDEYAATLKALNRSGYWWDPSMVNLLWDGAARRFRLVDIRLKTAGPVPDTSVRGLLKRMYRSVVALASILVESFTGRYIGGRSVHQRDGLQSLRDLTNGLLSHLERLFLRAERRRWVDAIEAKARLAASRAALPVSGHRTVIAAPVDTVGQPGDVFHLPRVIESELGLKDRLGQGGHSNTFALDGDDVAVLLKPESRGEGSAEHLLGQVGYMLELSAVRFEGRNVAPRPSRLIVTAAGAVVGYVTERVYGETLGDLALRGGLTDAQGEEVARQTRGQLVALHAAGRIHGDPNKGNILVRLRSDGGVEARFLDFERPSEGFGAEGDREILERTLTDADFARRPESVRRHFERLETERVRDEAVAVVERARPLAAEARRLATVLLRGVPETDEPARAFLSELRSAVNMGGKVAASWTLGDVVAAREKLETLDAPRRLRGLPLPAELAGPRDELATRLDGFLKEWRQPSPPDAAAAARAADERARPRHAEGPSLFGTFGWGAVVRAAAVRARAGWWVGRSARIVLRRVGLDWKEGGLTDELLAQTFAPVSGAVSFSANTALDVFRAAGYAATLDAAWAKPVARAVADLGLAGILPAQNVHVLSGGLRGPPGAVDEAAFAAFLRHDDGSLHVYLHETTLRRWSAREGLPVPSAPFRPEGTNFHDGYLMNALSVALAHEAAEASGVPHDDLAALGLTIDGLDEMYRRGWSAGRIAEEVRQLAWLASSGRAATAGRSLYLDGSPAAPRLPPLAAGASPLAEAADRYRRIAREVASRPEYQWEHQWAAPGNEAGRWLSRAYRDLLRALREAGHLEGDILYPFSGPDVLPAEFGRLLAINNDPMDFERGIGGAAAFFRKEPRLLEKIRRNIPSRAKRDAWDLDSYREMRAAAPGPVTLILKEFARYMQVEAKPQNRETARAVFRDVLRKGDKVVLFTKGDLGLLPDLRAAGFRVVEQHEVGVVDEDLFIEGGELVLEGPGKVMFVPDALVVLEKTDDVAPAEAPSREAKVDDALRGLIRGAKPEPVLHEISLRSLNPAGGSGVAEGRRQRLAALGRALAGAVAPDGAAAPDEAAWRETVRLDGAALIGRLTDMAAVSDVRREAAALLTSRVTAALEGRAPADWETFMAENHALLDVLHATGGSLFRSLAGVADDAPLDDEARAEYQKRDLQWLVSVSAELSGLPMNEGKDLDASAAVLDRVANRLDVRRKALPISGSFEAMAAVLRGTRGSLTSDRNVLFQVSRRMLDPKAGALDPAEASQLRLIAALSRWMEEADLLGPRRLILQVEGESLRRGQVLGQLAVRAGKESVARLAADRRVVVVASAEVEGYWTPSGEVSARALVEHLQKRGLLGAGVDVFALAGTKWDRTGAEQWVNLLITLAGDLVQNATQQLEDRLREIRLVRIQA